MKFVLIRRDRELFVTVIMTRYERCPEVGNCWQARIIREQRYIQMNVRDPEVRACEWPGFYSARGGIQASAKNQA